MRKLKGLLLLGLLLQISGIAYAANLYTNDCSGSEPPNNYTNIYFNGTTQTCSCVGGYAYVSETATGAKYSRNQYNLGSAWTNIALQFTVKVLPAPLTNTYMLIGVRSNGMDGAIPKCYYLQYYYNGSAYSFSLTNTDNSGTYSTSTQLYANDVIKFTVTGSSQPILEVYVNNVLILSSKGAAGFYAACEAAGSIMFGVKSPTGVNASSYAIDDITVDDYVQPPTNTPTKTSTVTPTKTPTSTPTFMPTPWMPYVEATAALPQQPQACCYYNHKVWVTGNAISGNVYEVDPVSLAVLHTVAVGAFPQGIHAFAGSIWASNFNDGTISKINPSTYTVEATITVGSFPQLMTDDGTFLYVGGLDGSNNNIASIIDPSGNSVAATLYLGGASGDPYACAWDGTNAWFSLFNTRQLIKINPLSHVVLATINFISDGITDLIYNGGRIFAAGYSSGYIFKVDATTNSASAIAVITPSSDAIYGLIQGGNNYYCTGYNSAIVYKLDSHSEQVVGNTSVANTPQGICFGDNRIFVTDALDSTIIRINPANDFPYTPTITPTDSPTMAVTPSYTPTVSATPTYTISPTPTITLTATITPSITKTGTISPTPTITPTATITPTITITSTITRTCTVTPTITPRTVMPRKNYEPNTYQSQQY